MKIEMGESLFYSWLRHVKECQIVQTNWKVSSQWSFNNVEEIEELFRSLDIYFEQTYNYKVFKKNASLAQIIQQGECDVLGINIQNGAPTYYAVDVAFHEAGLNYGTREETVLKVVSKSIRTAFCLYGYLGAKDADIVFASPKINNAILQDVAPLIEYVNEYFTNKGFSYRIRIICNEEFGEKVLQPILLVSDSVADTSELFMRGYQMFSMFANEKPKNEKIAATRTRTIKTASIPFEYTSDAYSELKIGKIVQTVLKNILESGMVADEEIEAMQTAEYSKRNFDIQFPLLVPYGADYVRIRYYSNPITIKSKKYYICSQWYETPSNNDRPYLLNWIERHTI